MPAALTALANATLAANAYSVTFNNIPNTYRDLFIAVEGLTAGNTYRIEFVFNGDVGTTTYFVVSMATNGSSALAGTNTPNPGAITAGNRMSPFLGSGRSYALAHIFDYSATDKPKMAIVRSGTGGMEVVGGRWNNNAAITSVRVQTYNGAGWFMAAGTTIALYGVSA